MFPDAKYIYWLRDPRDCIISGHKTDDLSDFGIKYPRTDDIRRRRAISWKYQYELMKATPRPSHCIDVRFEDFVMNNEKSIKKLCEHTAISPDIKSTYQSNLSKKNICKFSNLVMQNEIEKIERVFKEYTFN